MSAFLCNFAFTTKLKFTSAATNDSFMLAPCSYPSDSLVAMDRVNINYEKLETQTERNVVYVTKMKKNLTYEVLEDCMGLSHDKIKPNTCV